MKLAPSTVAAPKMAAAAKLLLVAATIGGAGYGVHVARPVPRPATVRLNEALALLDAHPPPLDRSVVEVAEDGMERRRAAALAASILDEEAKGVRPGPEPTLPTVPGAAAYVIGMETFGRANERRADYLTVASYLSRAEREGVPPPRRRRMLAANGLSLLRSGRPTLAYRRLFEATGSAFGDGGFSPADEATLWVALVDAALADGRATTLAEAAKRLNALHMPSDPPSAAALFRTRGRLAVHRDDEPTARTALAGLQRVGGRDRALSARLAMLAEDLPAARAALPPVPRFPLPADLPYLLLHGRIEEESGDPQLALSRYRAAATLLPGSLEALSARLAEGRILAQLGRYEEAVAALAAAVADAPPAEASGGDGGTIADRLREELRQTCLAAVQSAANDPGSVDHCVALCETVEPVLG
ncbi:MAG: hypothetical protein AAF907_09330, partial [Planctomycetota bacterium]